MTTATVDLLRTRLSALAPSHLEIIDESHLHAGHAGAKEGGHYRLKIVAEIFSGKNTVSRHRVIYDAVGDLMRGKIHALSIQANTPSEVQ